jgi:hypothetical protein
MFLFLMAIEFWEVAFKGADNKKTKQHKEWVEKSANDLKRLEKEIIEKKKQDKINIQKSNYNPDHWKNVKVIK